MGTFLILGVLVSAFAQNGCQDRCGTDTVCNGTVCVNNCAATATCCSPGAATSMCAQSGCVCAFDNFCCSTLWDAQCVEEAKIVCGLSCEEGGPYDELVSKLTSDSLQIAHVDDWMEQCVRPFADLNLPPGQFNVSNYQLMEQPSGLCAGHVTCGYEKCTGPYPMDPTTLLSSAWYDSSVFTDEVWKSGEGLGLPDAVVHPTHVGDVSETVKFASKHKQGVSVKTSGHSYTGSSTKKGTILLHLSKLQKYSPGGSIVECQIDSIAQQEVAYQQACDLAIARNKSAVIRVGGGEIWDEALRAVNMDWNENNDRKYHIVSGAAGTVSAAGGWLASGGLSGTNGMRQYGLGVDQVLHVEMVLPSGSHVRFGPTEWVEQTDRMYPVTTKVTGYCNMGELSDEDSWDWQQCGDEGVDFHDLWYAVRGGGGGAYGVVTSIYYQLHEFSPMQYVEISFIGPLIELDDYSLLVIFLSNWVEFLLRFMYLPDSIGVTEFESNSCSAPSSGGFVGGMILCHHGGGDVMKDAWGKFYGNGFTALDIDSYFAVFNEFESWAHWGIWAGLQGPSPDGRVADKPDPGLYPSVYTTSEGVGEFMMFPLDIMIEEKIDKVVSMLTDCMLQQTCNGNAYFMGGMIPSADDGLNSLPTHRRSGAYLQLVYDSTVREKFYQLFYGVGEGEPVTGNEFPGSLCHNHASAHFPTPLKEDWTKECLNVEDKTKCISFQEAAWGTSILKKLEKIHTAVDPERLFQCWDCVGYINSA